MISWGERVSVVWSNTDETASERWAHRLIVDRQQLFFFLSVITLCLSACLSVSSFTFSFYLLARYVVNASAIRTCINQHMPVIRFVFHLSTWRNHVRWHDYLLLLLATEMSLIHISIEMY